ncbi:MAG: DEAD/DEAH box helicase [Patescibacteria group bacterium]|nr:DEAD/DEAH box helicase [Patescibacteria group bacterium]
MSEYGKHGATLADRVLIVQAKTGTGKSTALPVALFRILRSENTPLRVPYKGPSVLCTQPRVLTAIDIATNQIAGQSYLPDMQIGVTVGYSTGSFTEKPPAGLVFATIGVLDAQLRSLDDSEIMEMYKFIIIDEAHERSIASDSTLLRLKNFYDRNVGNKKLPFLFFASATFDTALYAKYMGVGPENIVIIDGSSFPIETHYAEQGTNDFPKDSALKVIQLHEANLKDATDKADIMVFVPGALETKSVRDILDRKNKEYTEGKEIPPLLVLSLNRDIIQEEAPDYFLATMDPGKLPLVNGVKPLRRVVVATAASETGLTLNCLKYVIDCGFSRENLSYQPYGVGGLVTMPAPQSRIMQRRGRVGRKFPGEFFPMYTKNVFDSLQVQQFPEVVTSGMNELIIGLAAEQQAQKQRAGQAPEFLVEDIRMLGSPPADALLSALGAAFFLGFFSRRARLPDGGTGFGLTALGEIAARFARTPMEKIRMILAGRVWGASLWDLATIAAVADSPVRKRLMARMKPGAESDRKYYAIIRDAYPAFINNYTGGGEDMNLPPSADEQAYLRTQLLVADDFITAMLVVDKFIDRLDQADGDVQKVIDQCEELGLDAKALFDVVAARDEVIEDMFVAGLSPFGEDRRLSTARVGEFTDRVIALKRCIYEGFRLKLLTYDEKENVYVDRLGMRAEVPPILSDLELKKLAALKGSAPGKPRHIVTNFLELAKAPKDTQGDTPMIYTVKTRMVSVMDGFVDVDPSFVGPEWVLNKPPAEQKKDEFVAAAKDPRTILESYLRVCRATLPKCPLVSGVAGDVLFTGRRRVELVTTPFGARGCTQLNRTQPVDTER